MRWSGLLLALAACNPSGLTLEVVIDDPGIEKVELFAGRHCSGDCPRGTVPPQLPAMAVDRAYLVADEVPWSVSASDFDDGVAGFRIESAQDTSLDILVVLGYDAQDEIRWSTTFHDVAIPSTDSAYWRVELTPTAAIVLPTPQPPAGTRRAVRWQQPSKHLPSCVLLEHWDGSAQPERELVVPDGDHDCDEVAAAAECAPWIPNAVGAPPTIDEASCLLSSTLPSTSTTAVCLLGGPECNESSGAGKSCVPLDEVYCASEVLCACTGPDIADCVRTKIADGIVAEAIPFLHCRIQLAEDGRSCTDAAFTADAAGYVAGGATHCDSLRFQRAELPLSGFDSYLEIDATSKLKVERFTEACKAELYFAGSSTPHSLLALASLELDNANHLVVPVKLDLEATGCVESSQCEFVRPVTVEDSLWQCAGTNAAARCAPTPQLGCSEGPLCNGVCCKRGEYCSSLGCSCGGDGTRCAGGDTCQYSVPMSDQCGELCCGVTTPCPF